MIAFLHCPHPRSRGFAGNNAKLPGDKAFAGAPFLIKFAIINLFLLNRYLLSRKIQPLRCVQYTAVMRQRPPRYTSEKPTLVGVAPLDAIIAAPTAVNIYLDLNKRRTYSPTKILILREETPSFLRREWLQENIVL